MCGLLGVYSTNLTMPEYDIFEKLLYLNVWRGQDSTGIIRVGRDKKSIARKTLLSSPEFILDKSSDIIRDKFRPDTPYALLGHTRAATKGSVILKNSHPFAFDKVVGMHNGTIHKTFKGRNEYDTDSEALYRLINDDGIEEALNEVAAYDSAYALQWIDKKEKTLNFIKNSDRPLHFTYIYGGSTLIWSSTAEMLELILSVKNMKTNEGWKGDKKEKIFSLHDNDLLSIPLGEHPMSQASLTSLKVEKKAHVYTNHGTTGTSGTREYKNGGWVLRNGVYTFVTKKNETETKTEKTPTKNTSTNSSETAVEVPPYSNFRDKFGKEDLSRLSWLNPANDTGGLDQGDILEGLFKEKGKENKRDYDRGTSTLPFSRSEIETHLRNGCFSCGTCFSLDDEGDKEVIEKIHWWDRTYFACDDCYENSDTDWVRRTIDNDWSDENVA